MKQDSLIAVIAPLTEALGYEFVGLEFAPGRRTSLLRVYIDTADGYVTLDDCEKVSREVGAALDVDNVIPGAFNLEISSPGFDRPLFSLAHFARFAGRAVKLTTRVPIGGRRRFQGPIVRVDGDNVIVTQDGKDHGIAFANVERANLVPDFSAYMPVPKGAAKNAAKAAAKGTAPAAPKPRKSPQRQDGYPPAKARKST